jgi:ATP-binding cassette, subfamily B, heavy metal transporter
MAHPFASYTESPHKSRTDWQNLKSALPYIWDYRGRVILALIVLLLAKVANVGVPLVLKEIVDALNQPAGYLLALPLTLLLAYGALRLAASLFNELRDAIFAKVRYHAMRQLSNRAMSHLHSLALRYHLERKTGALSRDMERGTRSVSTLLNYMIFNIIPTAAEFLLVALIMLSQYHWQFTAITFATVAVYIAFTLKITNWRMEYRHQMNALESQANTQAVDSLINYETVKYFGNERLEARRYDETLAQWEDTAVKSQTSMSALNFGQGAIIAVGVTLIMIFAAQGVVDGSMSLGDLVLVNAFLLQLFIPLNFLGVVYRAINYALADMDLMFKTLHEPQEICDAPDARELSAGNGEVRFEHVSFGYTPERQILHNISFTIAPGHKVAVVGPSGSGKSTLARLLFRFYDVDSGVITINGQDIRGVSQASLRASIGIVPQDTVLFNDTLLYNIAYARPGASLGEVRQAARLAYIDEFIQKLPQAYETVVGERGLKLSGGEKQRVAIARVILKKAPVLVFDEATSALDSHAEQVIQQALHKVAAEHTTLVIAHRLSTIVDADEILVMEHGHIVERGSHAQLLAAQGVYARMWALQQEERELETQWEESPDLPKNSA